MTNYNERLDEILELYDNNRNSAFQHARDIEADRIELDGLLRVVANKAKQAITSLTKELVAEAKPRKYQKEDFNGSEPDRRKKAFNRAINQFEQNLLKALEEK